MKLYWIHLVSLTLAIASFTNPARADDPDIAAPTAYVRVLHGLSLGQKVDVYIDGNKKLNDVEFSAITKYLRLPAGYHSFRITTNNPTRTLISTAQTLGRNNFYTLSLYGLPHRMRLVLANDSTGTPAYGRAYLTMHHFSPGMQPFHVVGYIRGGRTIRLISNVRYGQIKRANIPAIPMTVRLVRNGRILKTLTGVEPRAGRKYAAYGIGRPSRNFKLMLDVTASQ